MFMTTDGLESKIEELFTNLYRQPAHSDPNGKVFGAPTEPSAPIVMLQKKGRWVIMINVLVGKK